MVTTSVPGSRADPRVSDVVDEVTRTLERVFGEVARVRDRSEDLVSAAAAEGRSPSTADLAGLRPLLLEQLTGNRELISGVGFIAVPGLLGDVPGWLEWWQTRADGTQHPLRLDLDPTTSAYSDYTHWEWFALPRTTGLRAVSGPYVDYLCSDEYSLTLSLPAREGDRFIGVAAADVYLRHFEATVLNSLQRLDAPACLVNTRGRVVASTDTRRLNGSLLKDANLDGAGVFPCGDIPLVLVTRTS